MAGVDISVDCEERAELLAKTQELVLDNEDINSSLPREYYTQEFQKLSPQEWIKSEKN